MQALRLAYRVSKDPANPLLRILAAEKANNLVAEELRFTIEQDDDGQVRVVWLDRAEQDRRNKSWRTPLAVPAGVSNPGRPAATGQGGGRWAAVMGVERPGQGRPSVTMLRAYPRDERGARLARLRCEVHPDFRPEARWAPGRGGELLSSYTAADGTIVRFAVTAQAG